MNYGYPNFLVFINQFLDVRKSVDYLISIIRFLDILKCILGYP